MSFRINMKISPPSNSRRKFLAWGALGALALAATSVFRGTKNSPTSAKPSKPPASPTVSEADDLVTLDEAAISAPNHEVFSPLINTEFTVEFPESSVLAVRLVEVTPITMIEGPQARYQCFSLFFETTGGSAEEGLIGRVTHPKLEPMDLFLAPVGRPAHGKILLEAAFTERV